MMGLLKINTLITFWVAHMKILQKEKVYVLLLVHWRDYPILISTAIEQDNRTANYTDNC
jgi:hypothetical protein